MSETDPSCPEGTPRARRVVAFLILPTLLLTILILASAFSIAAAGGGREAVEARLPGWIPGLIAVNHSIVFAALLWQLRREGRGLESIGWRFPGAGRLAGEVALGLVLAGLTFLLDDVAFDGIEDVFDSLLGGGSGGGEGNIDASLGAVPWRWLAVAVVFPWVEESLFRGWAISRLRTRWSLVLAVAVPTLLFGPLHWGQGSWAIVNATLLGLVFALVYLWRGNLWATSVAHSGFNAIAILEFLWR